MARWKAWTKTGKKWLRSTHSAQGFQEGGGIKTMTYFRNSGSLSRGQPNFQMLERTLNAKDEGCIPTDITIWAVMAADEKNKKMHVQGFLKWISNLGSFDFSKNKKTFESLNN
jgi:hypothetical protein